MMKKKTQIISNDCLSLDTIGFDHFHETIEDYESFLSVVSHDFAASIRHIKEFSKLLKGSLENLGDDQGLYFSYIEKSLKRLDAMQQALMTLHNIQTKEVVATEFSMQETLERVVKSINFDGYKSEPVISCEPLPRVKGAPDLMEILLHNLIDNACRYSPDNGQQKVFIRSFIEGDKTIFEIKDNGIGIDNEFIGAVFHTFRRLHPQDEYGGGIGAGLSIAKKIVKKHGEKIWMNSKLDQGTSVFF